MNERRMPDDEMAASILRKMFQGLMIVAEGQWLRVNGLECDRPSDYTGILITVDEAEYLKTTVT